MLPQDAAQNLPARVPRNRVEELDPALEALVLRRRRRHCLPPKSERPHSRFTQSVGCDPPRIVQP